MGMAASQARFLQLTARRTNIEYMGQQINQTRLALANASAGLFEKMLTLVPPTPPSSQNDKYYTQGYNFIDSADEIQKKISWSSVSVGASAFPPDVTTPNGDDLSITLTAFNGDTITMSTTGLQAIANGGAGAAVNGVADGSFNMADLANALGVPLTAGEEALGYTQVLRNITIEHTVYNPNGELSVVTKQAPALLSFDNLNRLLNVSLLDKSDIDAQDGATGFSAINQVGQGDRLTYSGVFDGVSFQDDMNKYEFQKAAYDYQIEKINLETKQVQAQDKSLELKMKQLDTEHNAVQTEMEAVQKVITKNIESSFKTFA